MTTHKLFEEKTQREAEVAGSKVANDQTQRNIAEKSFQRQSPD